jgi:hypothetical protein
LIESIRKDAKGKKNASHKNALMGYKKNFPWSKEKSIIAMRRREN